MHKQLDYSQRVSWFINKLSSKPRKLKYQTMDYEIVANDMFNRKIDDIIFDMERELKK